MPFVLIHGATFGAGAWGRLISLLADDVLAVDLPGRGARAHVDLRGVTLGGCAQAAADDIVQRDLSDIVLVAHSFGGAVAPGVMSLVPDRIRQVVLLSGVVPDDGAPVVSCIDARLKRALEASTVGGIYTTGDKATKSRLCNDGNDDQVQYVLNQRVDDATKLLTENVDLAGYRMPIPRTYIQLSRDRCYSPELQAKSVRRTGAKTATVDAGHMAMVTQPNQVASILNGFASHSSLW